MAEYRTLKPILVHEGDGMQHYPRPGAIIELDDEQAAPLLAAGRIVSTDEVEALEEPPVEAPAESQPPAGDQAEDPPTDPPTEDGGGEAPSEDPSSEDPPADPPADPLAAVPKPRGRQR